jgi:hypothetical protein
MIEVLKQMVEALEANRPINYCENGKGERFPMFENNPFRQEANEQVIQAGKKAIAELESQEPVAKLKTSNVLLRCHSCGYSDKLTMQIEYTHPPQRTWVGLTDEDEIDWDGGDLKSLIKAIEAKLKEKNT